MKGHIIALPADAPREGEQFRHYKGDHYEVVLLALHSNDEEWMVVYKPLYENPDAPYFTRPLHEWGERVEWEGNFVKRFTKLESTSEKQK
jgi:hypothetical protein